MVDVRWGLVGLGRISELFAQDLALVKGAKRYAVASRSLEKAKSFAEAHQFSKSYGSYDELFEDPEVDIVYIGTPHNSHAELSIKAMQHGKHVLCEKPVAINSNQLRSMISASRSNNRFLMEAFWTRFNPSVIQALDQVDKGVIGKLRYINADFAFHVPYKKGDRVTDIQLGGGALMDIGVYPLFLSYLFLGMPKKVLASSTFHLSGIDEQTSIILQYKDAQALLHGSFASVSSMSATLSGEKGIIQLNPIWHETESLSLIKNNHKTDVHLPTRGKGYTYEIEECHTCLQKGCTESALWTHKDSLNLISLTDEVRRQIGLQYPFESIL